VSHHRACVIIIIIIIIERIRLGWHKPKLRGYLTNVTKYHAFQSGKLREKSSVWSRRLKVGKELDEGTSSDRVFQTRAAAIGKVRSPTVYRFDVRTANVSDGRSLMLCRSYTYAGASPCRHRYTRTALL